MSEPAVTLELHGARDMVAAFKDLREYLPKTAVRTATRKAAQFLAQFVGLAAPKLTGKLARNIVVRVKRTSKTIRARVTVNTVGKGDNDANAFYWKFLEFGFHTGHGKGPLLKLPFALLAIETKKEAAAQFLIDSVEQAIVRAERKAKKAA